MEQSIRPSVSMILQRVQRIRQCRLQEQLLEAHSSEAGKNILICQGAIAQDLEESMKYLGRSESWVGGDFGDWHNAPVRTQT